MAELSAVTEQENDAVPVALPVGGPIIAVEALPVARPCTQLVPHTSRVGDPLQCSSAMAHGQGRTDNLAVASAVCGMTAIVPVISQVMGLVLGVAGLLRIRRAEQRGIHLRGRGWALAGLFSSGLVLAAWIAVFTAFVVLGSTFAHTTDVLPAVALPSG